MVPVYNLHEIRRGALQRVRASIFEQEELLKSMSSDDRHRYLIEALLRLLRANEVKLVNGLIGARPKVRQQ